MQLRSAGNVLKRTSYAAIMRPWYFKFCDSDLTSRLWAPQRGGLWEMSTSTARLALDYL